MNNMNNLLLGQMVEPMAANQAQATQLAQAPQQIPPLPHGVIPGTDDYFAWLESTGLAKTPADFKRIMQFHESQQAPMRGGVMDKILNK